MVSSDSLQDRLRSKVDKKLYIDEKENRDGIYLFLSFDLANATEYKIRNSQWHKTFKDFYAHINKEIKAEASPIQDAKIWKFIGDEVLFYLKVTQQKELFQSLPYVYKVIKNVEKRLSQESHYYDKLYIKTTIWIADILDENSIDIKKTSTEKATNIIFTPPLENTNSLLQRPDFLGFEIDLGFRISKYSHHSVIAIGAKLAYLLYKNRQDIKDNYKINDKTIKIDKWLKIISYENLKGIWRSHKYPIIWYTEDWDNESVFLYDEHFDSEAIQLLQKKIKKNMLDSIEKLEKIFKDVNQIDDIDLIIDRIAQTVPEKNLEIQLDKVSEVHVALICLNGDKSKILAALRPKTKKRFPNMWEFGCGQISLNETFEETARRTYKEDFGIDIEILNDSVPVATYSFEDSAKQTVPGIILVGYTNTDEQIKQEKYADVRWLTEEEIEKIQSDSKEYVDDFKINALKAFNIS
jgi:8-oxo-dGTP pyrophosphatase MutT (NUDIX family)